MFNVYSKDNQCVCEKCLTYIKKQLNVSLKKIRIKEQEKTKKGVSTTEKKKDKPF